MTDDEMELAALRVGPGELAGLPVTLRRFHKRDRGFVLNRWLTSHSQARQVADIPSETYYFWHQSLIDACIRDRMCCWLMACDPANPAYLYGFCAAQQVDTLSGMLPVVHYLFVEKPFRRFGLASRLLATLPWAEGGVGIVTHINARGKSLLRDTDRAGVYNPYLFMGRDSRIERDTGKLGARGTKLKGQE
jgi:GNAT superfamily N-acetyltransferase